MADVDIMFPNLRAFSVDTLGEICISVEEIFFPLYSLEFVLIQTTLSYYRYYSLQSLRSLKSGFYTRIATIAEPDFVAIVIFV